MAAKNDKYTHRITWSEDDNEYVGLCAEFPSLSWLADTLEKALEGIRKLVPDVLLDMQGNDEPIPEPIAIKQFSGKFMVRIPPDVYRKPAIQAAESGVSLNRIASSKLSQQVSSTFTKPLTPDTAGVRGKPRNGWKPPAPIIEQKAPKRFSTSIARGDWTTPRISSSGIVWL